MTANARVRVELEDVAIDEEVEVTDCQTAWRASGDVPDEDGGHHRVDAIGKTRGDAVGTWVGARIEREDGVRGKVKKGTET